MPFQQSYCECAELSPTLIAHRCCGHYRQLTYDHWHSIVATLATPMQCLATPMALH